MAPTGHFEIVKNILFGQLYLNFFQPLCLYLCVMALSLTPTLKCALEILYEIEECTDLQCESGTDNVHYCIRTSLHPTIYCVRGWMAVKRGTSSTTPTHFSHLPVPTSWPYQPHYSPSPAGPSPDWTCHCFISDRHLLCRQPSAC